MANSIIQLFSETVQNLPDRPSIRYRDKSDAWQTLTWKELDEERLALAVALIELGVKSRDRVNILSNSTKDWMVADLAIQSAGGTTVPIYQSNLAHEVEYIINDCGGTVVFAQDATQVAKLREIKDKIPQVQHVIAMDDEGADHEWVLALSKVMLAGKAKVEEMKGAVEERSGSLGKEDILTIIYTSGTTGMPKGVVLTHGNMLYEVQGMKEVGVINADDVQLLFLPMAHVFAKVLQCVWFGLGHELAVDAETTRIVPNMADVKPTMMCSVPRIFEKVYAKVVAGGLAGPGLKGKLFAWALSLNDRYAQYMGEGRAIPFGLKLQLDIARKLVFSKVNEKMNATFGGRLRFFVSGGAPLSKKIAWFFSNAGIVILEGYGLTETSAASCVNRPDKNKIGTVGTPVPGTEVKIAEDGEILIRGPGVMKEYWKREDATKEVIGPDGWFHSGDIGIIDADGHVKITDRKKDIIVTAGGKNVAPQNIENLVKASSPLISQVMVYGDRRKYLSALITLDPDNAIKFGQDEGAGSDYVTVTKSAQAKASVQSTIEKANSQLARYETIKKFEILDKDFEIGEELTPTMKVKRKFASEKYASILDGFYDEAVME